MGYTENELKALLMSDLGLSGSPSDYPLYDLERMAFFSGFSTPSGLSYNLSMQEPNRALKAKAPLLQMVPLTVTTGIVVATAGYDNGTGLYYGTSTSNGHYQTSTDANTWTDRTYSPSTYTPNIIGWEFDTTYMYTYSSDGRIWRALKNQFNAWTEITVSDKGSLTTGRSGSLCVLDSGILLYGNYTSNSGDGAHIWRSIDAGATWTHVLDIPAGKHVHCIRKSPNTNIIWATIGDAGFTGAGLWKSTDNGKTFINMATNDYGIDMVFVPASGGRPPLVVMEGDGLHRPLLMGFWENSKVGDKIFPVSWFTGAPSDPASTTGTTRGIALTTSGDIIFFVTTESGAVGSKAGIYIADSADYSNVVLLKDTTGVEPPAYLRTFISGNTVINYQLSFPLPSFAKY